MMEGNLSQRLTGGWSCTLNSPEFRRHPRVRFSAAFRTLQVTAFRFRRVCASDFRTFRCNRLRPINGGTILYAD